MILRRRERWERLSIKVDQFKFKKVDHFKHLGIIINEKNDITKKSIDTGVE